MDMIDHAPLPQDGQGLILKQPKFGVLDLIWIPLYFLLTYGLIHSILEKFGPNVYTTVCYLGIFAISTVLICIRQKRFAPKALLPGLLCIAMSLSFFLHSDEPLHIVLFLLLIPLSGFYCLALTGSNIHPFGSFYVLLDLIRCEMLIPIQQLPAPFIAAAGSIKKRRSAQSKTGRRRIWLPIVIGLIAAIPVLLIVIPLLLESDAAFESVAGASFRALQQAFEHVISLLEQHFTLNYLALYFSLFFSVYIFSVVFSFANGISKEKNKDTSAKYRKLQKAPFSFFVSVLGVVCAVYVVYLLSQTAYFFSAFSGHLPSGVSISVTEYARRGFLEMVKIAAINFLLIASSIGFCKRKENRIPSAIRWLDVFLCAFTILLCVVSIFKIWMYISSFGLTQKRLYVFAADIVLICCFAAIIIRLFKERFPYMKVILTAVFLCAAVLGLIGVNNTIARYNTNGLLNGRLQSYQAEELKTECGDAALPYLQMLAKTKGKTQKQAKQTLDQLLDEQWYRLDESFENREQARLTAFLREQNAKARAFTIEVELDTSIPIYGLLWEGSLNGKSVFSGGLANADETALQSPVSITIERRDLPKDADLSAFDLRFSVQTTPGDHGQTFEIDNEIDNRCYLIGSNPVWVWGCRYRLTLAQDEEDNFSIWNA